MYSSLAHQIATPVSGGGVAGASRPAVAKALSSDHRLRVAVEAEGGGCWVWRAWDPARGQHGVAVRTVQRLLGAAARSPERLHQDATAALRRIPPSQRQNATVPPAHVLQGWLEDTADRAPGLARAGRMWSWDRPSHPVDGPLLDAVRAGGAHGASTAELRRVLERAGYSSSSAKALAALSPVVRRTAPERYVGR